MAGAPRKNRRKSRISPEEAQFIEVALQSPSPVTRKQALQRLCQLYRRGGMLIAPNRMKAFVVQALIDEDVKVRRWAFNALAQLGEAADVPLMMQPWKNNRSEPEVFEAGLTALAHMLPKEELLAVLKQAGVELDPSVLMALGQQTDKFAGELALVRLGVGQATDSELRGATLLIGLKKSPDTLFSGRFPVSDVIGDLNTHGDAIVAQYSFWATVEHPDLGLENIRVKPENFSQLPPNVQGWAYRVLTKDGTIAMQNYDSIVEGSESRFEVVREGVATGLRHIYYDSLDVTVADWFLEERSPAVKDALLEHMAAHVVNSSAYRDEVLRAYKEAASNSVLRSRLEAANHHAEVALEMRKMAFQMDDPQLFASVIGPTMNNTQNFNATVNTGGISNSGVGNQGTVQFISAGEAQAAVLPILQQLLQALEAPSAPAGSAEGAQLAKEAIAEPTKGRVEHFVGWLKSIKDGGEALSGIGALAMSSYDKIAPYVQHLPAIMS